MAQNNFQIVHRPKPTIIKIVESVVIHQQIPTHNNMDSLIPLKPYTKFLSVSNQVVTFAVSTMQSYTT